jgi:hypothetical protein
VDREVVKEYVTDAIRYWEPRRIIYNGALVAVVVAYFVVYRSHAIATFSVDSLLMLFLLAVLANVAYCAVYVVDLVWQVSGFRDGWRRRRWILLLVGVLFAAILARYWTIAMFAGCCG